MRDERERLLGCVCMYVCVVRDSAHGLNKTRAAATRRRLATCCRCGENGHYKPDCTATACKHGVHSPLAGDASSPGNHPARGMTMPTQGKRQEIAGHLSGSSFPKPFSHWQRILVYIQCNPESGNSCPSIVTTKDADCKYKIQCQGQHALTCPTQESLFLLEDRIRCQTPPSAANSRP